MKLAPILATVAAATIVFAQSPKTPPSRKSRIEEVRATGCVKIARDGCILLRTLDGQTTYTFQAAPKPDEDTVITIEGTAHDGRSQCREGIAIDVTDWHPTGEMCAVK
jgi:hypothetical protein